jgi:hypothetical protein
MRRTLTILGLGSALLIGAPVLLLFASPTFITVRNDSGNSVTGISVTVQGRTLGFPDLSPGDSARRWIRNTGADDHFALVARRNGGAQIRAEEGYITSGTFYSAVQFIITPSGTVVFTENHR